MWTRGGLSNWRDMKKIWCEKMYLKYPRPIVVVIKIQWSYKIFFLNNYGNNKKTYLINEVIEECIIFKYVIRNEWVETSCTDI